MYRREDDIADATYGTFDWLLRNETESPDANAPAETSRGEEPGTLEELEGERRQENAAKISEFLEHGRGVFFLRGKPGSGKSTLMKYLIGGRGKREVDRILRKWAEQKKLVRVSAMFVLHGTPLQRSLEGFYRTIFFELVCQCPELSDILFPSHFTRGSLDDSYRSSFRLETLQEAWQRLTSIDHHDSLKICVSIDGMDELEGSSTDRFKFARMLNEWAESGDIKIICSGRPNAEFNIVFDQPHRRIDLQDLTRADIREILTTRFEEIRHFSDLTRDNIEELVDDISNQSEGVILWAVLVGKNLEDDIIHGKPLSVMKRTILTLPSGIEDLFNDMWRGLRQDAHQQLMLRTIYEILVLYHGAFGTNALKLSWLEDALADDRFPYDEPIQAKTATELNCRIDKVRGQLVQYTRHFVEVDIESRNYDERYLCGYCRFIHRSAQEFIQAKLDLVGSVPAPGDYIFDLDLRLNLMLEMSVERDYPTDCFVRVFSRPFYYPERWLSYRQGPLRQVQYGLMKKLEELLEVRRRMLSCESTTGGSAHERWHRVGVGHRDGRGLKITEKSFSLVHLAAKSLQLDYVTRILNNRTQQLDRESVCLGLFICVTWVHPSSQLFELLVDHGADPDFLVEVYSSETQSVPENVPLWLLFCFTLAFKVAGQHVDQNDDEGTDLSEEFLILERFPRLGHGANITILAAPADSQSAVDDNDLFGIDLAQVIRAAEPDNMSRLLLLLEPAPATYASMLQRLTNFVLQPQFPFRTLPQGAKTIPYRRVSDEDLRKGAWEVRIAFEGEHEVRAGGHYYIPG
jgi:hypothetical protein